MRAMTPKAARNSRSKSSVSGTLAALPRQATGTPSPLMAMWYLLPLLARSVGLGPTRSPPRLARTEQLSRIRVGLPRSIATSSACTLARTAFSAQKARNRRRVEPLTCSIVARRLRHGRPSRRNRRRVAITRTSALRGWPGPRFGGGSQATISSAIRSRSLKSNMFSHIQPSDMGSGSIVSNATMQPQVIVKTASYYIVSPYVDEVERLFWSSQNVHVVQASFGEFFTALDRDVPPLFRAIPVQE